jgi:hypothetical protein
LVWDKIVRKVNNQDQRPSLVEEVEPSSIPAEKVRKSAEGINFASDDESIYLNH